ncbi:MAG: hypothetical protein M0Q91_06420 [Methanoregula sp.]|jgi:hypothetical protein|nr:hypothetical protein [Methanoregula sp.]
MKRHHQYILCGILLAGIFALPVPASAVPELPTGDPITQSPLGEAYLFQAGPTTFLPQQCEPADLSKIPPLSITIDPINWHSTGESFLIRGTTCLPTDQEILIEVMTEDFMSLKSNPKNILGQTVTVRSIADADGIARWEYKVNTSGWIPDKYLIQVTPLPENGGPHFTGHFYLVTPKEATSIRQLPVTVDPVPYYYDGETFLIGGNTTLPPGQELTISVMPGSFLRMDGAETLPGNMSMGMGGKTRVETGSNGANHWSFNLNTTGLGPTTYVIDIFPPSGDRAGRGVFFLDSNPNRVCRILTVPVTPSPTPSQIPAEATVPTGIVIGSLFCAGLLVSRRLK